MVLTEQKKFKTRHKLGCDYRITRVIESDTKIKFRFTFTLQV